MRGRIERDASLYFVGKAGAALGVFAAIPLTTRGLGASAFADFALWSAVSLSSATACVGWLQTGIGRLHRERRVGSRFAGYIASVRVSLGFGAFAAAVLVCVLASALSDLSPGSILGFAALAATTAMFMGYQALALADLEALRVGQSDLVRGFALPLAIGVAALIGGLDVATAALAHAFALGAAVLVLPAFRVRARARPVWAELRPLARYGLPIGLWSVIGLGNAQLGRVALEISGDHGELGLYAAVQEVVVKGGTLLLMPVVSAIHGHAMAMWATCDHAAIRSGLRRAFAIQAAIGAVLVIGALLGADVLAGLLFGAAAPTGATAIAVLLAIGVVAANMGLLAHKGLELGHATATMVLCILAALAMNSLLCALLVPHCGAIGAAVGFAASQIGYAVLALACSRRRMLALGFGVPNRAASRSGRTTTATL